MRLVQHQFRNDLRHFRTFLIIWQAMLMLDLMVSLGLLGTPAGPNESAAQALFTLVPAGLVGGLGFGLILGSAMLILADSPVNPDGFMATRPMPRKDWLLAKALFLVIGFVLPATLQELLHLLLAGLPLGYVMHGALERLVYVAPICLASACLVWLSRSLKEFLGNVFAAAGVTWLLAVLVLVISELVLSNRRLDDSYIVTRGLVFLYTFCAGLLALAGFGLRLRWHRWWRLMAVTAVTLMALAVAMLWPKDLFAPRPAAPGDVAQAAAQGRFLVPARSLQLSLVENNTGAQVMSVNGNLRPRQDLALTNSFIEWTCPSSRLIGSDGRVVSEVRGLRAASVYRWDAFYSPQELQILSRLWPAGARLESDNLLVQPPESCWLGVQRLPRPVKEMTANTRLQTDLLGRVFRWEKVAEVDLLNGAKARDAFGAWRVVSIQGQGMTTVYLERRQINLATAREQAIQISRYWPANQYAFMLYDPAENRLTPTAQRQVWGQTFFRHTAYSTHSLVLNFNERQGQRAGAAVKDNLPLDPPQVLIFRRRYLGDIRHAWTSPEFVLADTARARGRIGANARSQASRAEFLRRFKALKIPNAASRPEVARYLAECLRLVEATGRPANSDNPMKAQLAAYAPAHLPLFLAMLDQTQGWCNRVVMDGIQQGVTESQKGEILAALRRNPSLAEVVAARGWIEDARPELLYLLNSPQSLPYECWRTIAWLQAPETYPLLLQQLELNPDVWLYDLLHTLPGIEPELNVTVDRIAKALPPSSPELDNSLLISSGGNALRAYPGLEVAMKAGRPGAFRQAYRLLSASPTGNPSGWYDLVEFLKRNVVLQGIKPEDRWNNDAVLKWLAAHQPEEFQFDPVRRRWVLDR